jgi:hypothetical protein
MRPIISGEWHLEMDCFTPQGLAIHTMQTYFNKHVYAISGIHALKGAIQSRDRIQFHHATLESEAQSTLNSAPAFQCSSAVANLSFPPAITNAVAVLSSWLKPAEADAHPSPTQPSQCLLRTSSPHRYGCSCKEKKGLTASVLGEVSRPDDDSMARV